MPVLLAGGVAEAELAVRVSGDEGVRVDAYGSGAVDLDIATLRARPADWVDTLDEAVAIQLVRQNWAAVLRLAAALLAAPNGRLNWEQQTNLAGTIAEADEDAVMDLHERLDAGQLELLTARVHAHR
ncbi:hypothetical protein IC607_08620 [Cellulomonas sp. JH27-2]|uniref:hypothetical protein n=1 Tax=Cellulomonas sp. JH27-2 TaxID=2774139 RepID=UPI00177D55B2|nr:hypothetical protein [Cellulomonas sp. JH27-2]MBD8059030.1 hypothetical protein [Cellulomonas sp. JH27-2]